MIDNAFYEDLEEIPKSKYEYAKYYGHIREVVSINMDDKILDIEYDKENDQYTLAICTYVEFEETYSFDPRLGIPSFTTEMDQRVTLVKIKIEHSNIKILNSSIQDLL